jgi:membrane protein implicated in regulation of membrane protease activity
MITRPSVFALKAGFSVAGLAVGLVGMALEARWLVWAAVGLVGVAFLLRFAGRKQEPQDPEGLR